MGTDCHTTSLNNDGTELYLFKNDNYDGNIYVTRYTDGKWSPIEKLNRNINTRFYESHAAISSDGKKLYFTSTARAAWVNSTCGSRKGFHGRLGTPFQPGKRSEYSLQ